MINAVAEPMAILIDIISSKFVEINNVKIIPAPYVIIPTLGERLDYRFSVPQNSKVVIRIFDMNGNFVTSLLDDFFISSGTIQRYEDKSDWDGMRNFFKMRSHDGFPFNELSEEEWGVQYL